jgi:hypothetical protein
MLEYHGQLYCPYNGFFDSSEKNDITVHNENTKKNVFSTKDTGSMYSQQEAFETEYTPFNSTLSESSLNEKRRNLIIR